MLKGTSELFILKRYLTQSITKENQVSFGKKGLITDAIIVKS